MSKLKGKIKRQESKLRKLRKELKTRKKNKRRIGFKWYDDEL